MVKQQPKQKRSRETRDKIILVAEKLFSDRGYDEVNTNIIAKEAGVSVGAFYHHFKDKKDVLLAVLDNFGDLSLDAMGNAIIGQAPDFDTEQIILEMIKVAVKIHRQHADLMKTVDEQRHKDRDVSEYLQRIREKNESVVEVMLRALEAKRGIEIENIQTKAKMLMTTVECLCRENFLRGLGIKQEEFISELKNLIVGYLGVD